MAPAFWLTLIKLTDRPLYRVKTIAECSIEHVKRHFLQGDFTINMASQNFAYKKQGQILQMRDSIMIWCDLILLGKVTPKIKDSFFTFFLPRDSFRM